MEPSIFYNKDVFYSDSEDELSETELEEWTGGQAGSVSIGGNSNVIGAVSRDIGNLNGAGGSTWRAGGLPNGTGGSIWRAGGYPNGSGGSGWRAGESSNGISGSALTGDGSRNGAGGGSALRGDESSNGDSYSLWRAGGPANVMDGSTWRVGGPPCRNAGSGSIAGGYNTEARGSVSSVGSSDMTDITVRGASGGLHSGTISNLVPVSPSNNVTSQNVTSTNIQSNNLTSRFQGLGLSVVGHSREDGASHSRDFGASVPIVDGPFDEVFPSLVSAPGPSTPNNMTVKIGTDNNLTVRVEGLSYSSIAKKEPQPPVTPSVVQTKPTNSSVGHSRAQPEKDTPCLDFRFNYRFPLHDHRWPKDHQMVIGPITGDLATINHDLLYCRLRDVFQKYGHVTLMFVHKYPAKNEGPLEKYGYVVFKEKGPAQRILMESPLTLPGHEGDPIRLRKMI